MTATTEPDRMDPFADLNEVKSEILPFGKIGDWIRGTYTNKNQAQSKFTPGKMDNVYEFKAQGGIVHDKEGKEIALVPGSFYVFWSKASLDNFMRGIKIGQIFGISYTGDKPSTKGNPQKIFRTAAGTMDASYMGETAETTETVSAEDIP